MKTVVILLALTALSRAEPSVTRWDAFPGPETAAPTSSEVFAVCPATAGIWGRNVDFVVAQVEARTARTVTIQVQKDHFEVPAAFSSAVTRVGLKYSMVAVGGYVRFATDARSGPMHVGRVSAVGDHSYSIAYDIGGGLLSAHDVSPLETIPFDGKLRFGGPVSFDRDHHRAFGWYVGPGNARDTSWVVSSRASSTSSSPSTCSPARPP